MFPIPGTQRTKYLEQNVEAFFMDLSKEEVAYLSDVFAPGKVCPHFKLSVNADRLHSHFVS